MGRSAASAPSALRPRRVPRPSARGRGVATQAVEQLLRWVAAQGAGSVRLEVLAANTASLRLAERLGFVDVGEHAGHRVLVREVCHTG